MWVDSSYKISTDYGVEHGKNNNCCTTKNISSDKIIIEGEDITLTEKLKKKRKIKSIKIRI